MTNPADQAEIAALRAVLAALRAEKEACQRDTNSLLGVAAISCLILYEILGVALAFAH